MLGTEGPAALLSTLTSTFTPECAVVAISAACCLRIVLGAGHRRKSAREESFELGLGA